MASWSLPPIGDRGMRRLAVTEARATSPDRLANAIDDVVRCGVVRVRAHEARRRMDWIWRTCSSSDPTWGSRRSRTRATTIGSISRRCPRARDSRFFHATEHLRDAIAAISGDGTFATRYEFEYLRERLLTEDDGAESVINAFTYLRRKPPRSPTVKKVLSYFRKNKTECVAATYQREIHALANVIEITPKPEKKRREKASR